MREMLGNQYFLARRFDSALKEFEEALTKDPKNNTIKKKLMICYITNFDTHKAFELFLDLFSSDTNIFLNVDPLKDDCPCPEIIFNFVNHPNRLSENNLYLSLGMLYMCCDIKESQKYFNRIVNKRIKNTSIIFIVDRLNNIVNKQKKGNQYGKEELDKKRFFN